MGKIKMGGSAVMEFEPDFCEFHITVSITKDTSSEAVIKGRQRVEEVLHLLTEKVGLQIENVTLKNENTQFSSYSNKKYYRYSKSFYFRYQADNKLTDIVVKTLETIDDIEYDVKFKLADETEKNQIVMSAAVDNARQKAEKLANALGTKINGFEEIRYEFHDEFDEEVIRYKFCCGSVPAALAEDSLAAKMGSPKIEISKSVDVVWLTE